MDDFAHKTEYFRLLTFVEAAQQELSRLIAFGGSDVAIKDAEGLLARRKEALRRHGYDPHPKAPPEIIESTRPSAG